MVSKIPKWQIKKNVLDLEYRNAKDWINNLTIICATIIIGFLIAFLQGSIPEKFVAFSGFFLVAIICILIVRITDLNSLSKGKLEEINKLGKI